VIVTSVLENTLPAIDKVFPDDGCCWQAAFKATATGEELVSLLDSRYHG